MIFDLLPYKRRNAPRKKIGFIRLIVFLLLLATVMWLFVSSTRDSDDAMFYLFIFGNALYYAIGIIIALILKDSRVFCKYVCPVTVFSKPMSYFSLLRVYCDESKCVKCFKCLKVCPMDVEINRESRKRQSATECILCYECVKVCPVGALH